MKTEEIRNLKLLTEISSGNEPLTQRRLAKTQGVALGLANLLLRRLINKGFIKIKNVQGRRLRYLITPEGIVEKARLTYEYLDYSLYFYRQIRQFLADRLAPFAQADRRDILIIGTGEVAEIAYLTIQQLQLKLVGIIDNKSDHRTFLGVSVHPFSDLGQLSFDAVVVASLKDRDAIHDQLVQINIDEERIVAIPNRI